MRLAAKRGDLRLRALLRIRTRTTLTGTKGSVVRRRVFHSCCSPRRCSPATRRSGVSGSQPTASRNPTHSALREPQRWADMARVFANSAGEAWTVEEGALKQYKKGQWVVCYTASAGQRLIAAIPLDGRVVVLARKMRDDARLCDVKLMLLTSACQRVDVRGPRDAVIVARLPKPFSDLQLRDAIVSSLKQTDAPTRVSLAAKAPPHCQKALRILVAEDNVVNQKLAKGLLEKQGHTVIVATDGKEALSILEREAVDLILMDAQMPNLDGLAATAAIREKEKAGGSRLPIVAITARAMSGDREICLSAGMDAYITKPIEPSELFRVIQELTDSQPVPW